MVRCVGTQLLERKRPGSMPGSFVAPLYKGLVHGLIGGQLDLAWVVLEPLGLETGP